MYISIIVPVYNENLILQKNLIQIFNFFQDQFKFEIIVVNDGSTDSCHETIKKMDLKNLKLINNKRNMGKGYSIINGIKNSSGDVVLITDADLSTPIIEFNKLIKIYQKGYDFVIGSRGQIDSDIKVRQNYLRILMGETFNLLVRLILNLKYKDTQCGFKLFNGDKIREIAYFCKLRGFCIDVEILYLAKLKKIGVFEKGIIWNNDTSSSVNLFKDPLLMFIDLIKIKLNKY